MAFDPGKLDTRITLQQATNTPDTHGGNVQTWPTDTASRSAWVEYPTGSEVERGDKVEGRRTIRVRMRYFSVVASDWRIKIGSDVFGILAVLPDKRADELEIQAVEVDP